MNLPLVLPDSAPVHIGLFGVGLDTYWPQFEGLKDRLLGYQSRIRKRLAQSAEVTDAGLVDHPSQAAEAASIFNRAEVDAIFLYVSTYALSSTSLITRHSTASATVA
jgi:L-arabinose isomerase